MATRIQWRRTEGGNAIPHYQEDGKPGWRPYTHHQHRQQDSSAFSKGMPTWRYWLKLGYTVIPGVGND